MSDFDLNAVRARQAEARARAAAVDLDRPRYDPAAIAECPLCDDDGYRGGAVCDHVDRTETARRGIAKVRAALAQKQLKIGDPQ